MHVLLISTYELGRQPFGLASPAAWLRRAGATVTCLDLSREPLRHEPVRSADLIAFYVPMHTATRLAIEILPAVRSLNPTAHLCFYGLYAPVNEAYLRKRGAETILGGEFEAGLVAAYELLLQERAVAAGFRPAGEEDAEASASSPASDPFHPDERRHAVQGVPTISLARQGFIRPDRDGLPPLSRYARLLFPNGDKRVVGYTEASRGCRHLCRHCPIVPVYNGVFRIVQKDVVLDDIREQMAAGAEHITFGDPDFFNGPRHALDLVAGLHSEFPNLTYDVTIKIEHLLKYAQHLATLRATGCLFVTSAVESVDDRILAQLEKGHTFADFVAVVELFREVGLHLAPTFVAFTPWTSLGGYIELLRALAEMDLIDKVAPIQLAIRLLIPAGSRLLDLPEVRRRVGPFNKSALVYPWANDDPRVDDLCRAVQRLVEEGEKRGDSRRDIFGRIWARAHEGAELEVPALPDSSDRPARAAIPYLTEPWFC